MTNQEDRETDVKNSVSDGMFGIKEAIEFTRLSRAELYVAMAKNQLRYFRFGRRRLIAKADLITWLSTSLTASRS